MVRRAERFVRRRPRRIPNRATRQVLTPTHPRAAQLFLEQALRRVGAQLERAMLEALDPHIASFAAPDPETKTDAADDGVPAPDTAAVLAALRAAVDGVLSRTRPQVVSAGKTAGDRVLEHSKRESERLGITEREVRFVPHPNAKKHETTVLVDADALDAAWQKDTGYHIPAGGGGSEIGGRRTAFAEFLKKGEEIQASRVTFDPETGRASFIDGRHRFSVLRDMGVDRVAVTIPMEDLKRLPAHWAPRKIDERHPSPRIKVDLLKAEPKLGPKIAQWREKNADLIVSVSKRKVERVKALLENKAGMRVEALRDAIQESVGATKQQAALIARDQVLKLNGQITEARHVAAGIEEYVWTCAGDERVRGRPGGLYPDAKPSHWELDGKRIRWDRPPVSAPHGGRGHPGTSFQCRCTAYPILPELEDLK